MAKVDRFNRIAAGRILTAAFLHIEAMKSALWLDEFNTGLTPREKAKIDEVRKQLYDAGEELRQMGGAIRASLK